MRFRTVSLTVSVVGMALVLSGCSRIKTHQGYFVDNLLVDSISPGVDNRESVEGTLGRPSFVSQFGQQDWYYVSRDMKQLAFANPAPKEQTVIHVAFDTAGNVASIERTGIDKVVELSPKDGKTPTLGRQRGILEDIFGNIGAVGAGGAGAGADGGPGPNGG